MPTGKSQALSLAVHTLIALLLLIAARSVKSPIAATAPIHAMPLIFFHPPQAPEARSGGSNQTAFPAKQGSPPPRAPRTFIPPQSSEHPPLALPITISFDIPLEGTSSNIGDPLSKLAIGSLGKNGVNGIGDQGGRSGIGDGPSGPQGIAGIHRERGVRPPELIYKVEPEYSEEARKAKYQGIVVLEIEVDSSGNVGAVRVQRGLGLGLDEKAIDAVSHWRFHPGVLNGKPVATEARVQVHFQLL
ncbi:MAG TPA: energy transducer TonB [Bryobacteraceae bacterium]|nr:energy transducer TonB [Bryobacteraceae bacterium]